MVSACVACIAGGRKDMSQDERHVVEVYQPRSLSEFTDDDGNPTDEEMFNDLRDLRVSMSEGEDLDFEDFGRLYDLVGTEVVHAYPYKDEEYVLGVVWERWNNGSGKESDTFRAMNAQRRAVSMSAGNIVRVNGTAYYCASIGWNELPALSYGEDDAG